MALKDHLIPPQRNTAEDRARLFVTVGIFTVAAGAYLNVEYASTMPRSAQPRVGRIFKVVVNHGTTVYINEKDFDKLNLVDLYLGPGLDSVFLSFAS